GDSAAATSELASLGGLLQALGAGVIGNGALLYPTAASSHQREESEIMASDTATRVFKKVRSILKEGGINEDDNGDDESKSVTYLIKPAMIYHKEELPPPNPLAGNVLPLPGGALMYTPTPTANAAAGEPTSGPAASIKAAYGNLFAASPYTPSYTLNKPHAAVIVEEITDMISLKSSLQRLEDAGEDVDDEDSDEEDDYGRKKHRKAAKIISLETIDSTSTFVNPFTRADFPFGLMTPAASPAPTPAASSSRKTIKKTIAPRTTDKIRASMGKDGGITVVNNAAPSTSQGTTIVIPAASLQSSTTAASASESPAASSSHEEPKSEEKHEESKSEEKHEESKSEEKHEESKGDDLKANEVTRLAHAHKTSAKPDFSSTAHVKGLRREAASSFDPLGATDASSAMSTLASLASDTAASATPSVTVGSSAASAAATASADGPKRRKMHIVRVYEVKKNKSASGESSSTSAMHKRDFMPVYDAAAMAAMPTAGAESAARVSNWERVIQDEANDNEDDEDEAETTVEVDDESAGSDMPAASDAQQSDLPESDAAEAEKQETAAESSSAAEAKEEAVHNTTSKSLSIETIGAVGQTEDPSTKDESLLTTSPASSSTAIEKSAAPSSTSKADSDSDSDTDSDNASENGDSDSDSDSDEASEGGKDSDDESDNEDEKEEKDTEGTRARGRARVAVLNRDQPLGGAIQRMAALGLREAEKAIEDFDQNSDASDIEVMTDDANPDMGTATSAILSPAESNSAESNSAESNSVESNSAESSVSAAAVERAAETPAPSLHARAANDDDDDSDDDNKPAKSSSANKDTDDEDNEDSNKASSSAKKDEDSDDDDSDDSDDKSADSDSESDDSDSESDDESSRPAKSSTQSRNAASQSMAVNDSEDEAARKALSEAAAESFQQAVGVEATLSESALSADESEMGSALARDAADAEDASENASENASDNASENASDNASDASEDASGDDVIEFETEAGVNSDGEEVEFITQLVPETARKNVNESPSVVVMASIDEEYEEDYFTDSHAARSASSDDDADDSDSMAAPGVQRNAAANDDDDNDDEPVVRGAEPTPDVGAVKESQLRAMNIGLGNLRRHV
ncbi:hypothetical protein H4S01_002069, partial [Coemansia sp. RSA 2610]